MIDRRLNYGRHHIRRFLERARPFETVLDLGAGHGADLELAAEVEPEAKRLAVEVHPPYTKLLYEGGVDEVVSIDIERELLPFDAGSIEVIITNQLLEHIKEVFWLLHEVSRVLTVGGKFIVGVPNLAALHNRILLMMGRQPSPIKTASAHVRGFTKRDLLTFLEAAYPYGYRLESFGGSNFYPFPPLIAKPLATILPNMAWGIFLMLEKQRSYKEEFLEFPISNQLETNFYLGE